MLFQHLIDNAIKFRSETPPQIRIECIEMISHWQFAVSDNGIGIPKEYSNRVFIVFQRLHPREKYEGTGVGLALCQKIVELHGGSIWIEEKKEPGSRFCFTLKKMKHEHS